MPDTGLFRYIKRGLNFVSYGGTGFLAGQGMWEGGQALWEEINSKNCSGWRIAGNIVGIGLNGVSLFFSGKGFISETKTLNEMLKDDGVYDKLLETLKDNGGYINFDAFKSGNIAKNFDTNNIMTKQDILDSIPDDWNYTEHNNFVHIRDADGNIRIRIDPPDKVTNYPHVHVFDTDGNLLNLVGNIVDRKSPEGHIPYKNN